MSRPTTSAAPCHLGVFPFVRLSLLELALHTKLTLWMLSNGVDASGYTLLVDSEGVGAPDSSSHDNWSIFFLLRMTMTTKHTIAIADLIRLHFRGFIDWRPSGPRPSTVKWAFVGGAIDASPIRQGPPGLHFGFAQSFYPNTCRAVLRCSFRQK
uniref:Secreted protein n=1 Tax=Panagrellus redivivus TaxID=6233 RepID=A0A7E4ZR46_PANRE